MRPTGPSPRVKGSFISISSACIMAGRVKVRVLPDPVKAIPIMSRPENLMLAVTSIVVTSDSRSRDALYLDRCRLLDSFLLKVLKNR